MRQIAVAALLVVALASCTGETTPSATPSSVPSPTVTPFPAVTLSPAPSSTRALSLVDKEPGAVTLSYGKESQIGSGGGGTWCARDICRVGDIFDFYSAPATALIVPQGGMLTFAYLGYNAILSVQIAFYPFPPPNPRVKGSYSSPDSRLERKVDVTHSGQEATFLADVSPGEYMVIAYAAITDGSNAKSNLYFHFRVFVQ